MADDLSARILARTPIQIAYGRDQARSLAPIRAGTASFELDNTSRDYTIGNSSSPLFGMVGPGREVLIEVSHLGLLHTLYRGYLDDFTDNPDLSQRSVSMTCLDAIGRLDANMSTPVYQGLQTGDAIGLILDAIGWDPALRDLDQGATTVRTWWAEGISAFQAISDLVNSEGPPAFVYAAPDGSFVFRDRTHRLRDYTSVTLQNTWRDTGAEPCFSACAVDDGWRDIVNAVNFTVDVRAASTVSQVWQSSSSVLSIPSGTTISVAASASDPFISAITPVQGVDYTLISGTVSVALSRTSGQSTTIMLTASGGPAQIQGLTLRATPLPVAYSQQVTQSDPVSITTFGEKTWPNAAPHAGVNDAVAIADLIVTQRSQRLPTAQVEFRAAWIGNDARLVEMFSRDLSNRIHLVNSQSAVDADFYVEQIAYAIDEGGSSVKAVFGVEMASNAASSSFVLDTSTLGTGTLGYGIRDDPSRVFVLGSSLLGTGLLGH